MIFLNRVISNSLKNRIKCIWDLLNVSLCLCSLKLPENVPSMHNGCKRIVKLNICECHWFSTNNMEAVPIYFIFYYIYIYSFIIAVIETFEFFLFFFLIVYMKLYTSHLLIWQNKLHWVLNLQYMYVFFFSKFIGGCNLLYLFLTFLMQKAASIVFFF